MTKSAWMRTIALGLALILGLAVAAEAQAQAQAQRPPEIKELIAASRIQDASARLKEFERIKAAYPKSQYLDRIDMFIFMAKVELAPTLEAVLGLQKGYLTTAKGADRVVGPLSAVQQIMAHPKFKTFDKAQVTSTVIKFRDESLKAAADPASFNGVAEDEVAYIKAYYLPAFEVILAQAHLNEGNTDKAFGALQAYKKEGGAPDAGYSFVLAEVLAKQGKTKEALDSYLDAAIENYAGAADKAKALYVQMNGKPDGFEDRMEAKQRQVPYEPAPFKASAEWKGKAVLAEVFTGSECPPCVGADLAYDGLIESYPAKYLAVLEYHLPIPRPDPMMNPATKKRQEYYGVNSTPTVVIDGDQKMVGGGSRGMSGDKYKQFAAAVNAKVNAAPAVGLKAAASRAGDTVKVECGFDQTVPGAEYFVALVQKEEKYKGSNGVIFHKMVVRDLVALDPAGAKAVTFNLAASEKATDLYLTDFEKTNERFPNYKFPERHAKIDRQALRAVFFVQDKASKKVLNAVAAEVK